MSNTNEASTVSDFNEATKIIRSYIEVIGYTGVDRVYSWVFEYHTHPGKKGQLTPEFVHEVLDSLEKNITTYGLAKAKVATLYKYI